MIPTEYEGTVAVDAAARKVYDDQMKADVAAGSTLTYPDGWDTVPPLIQNAYREQVLPVVWAALGALPDRGGAALRDEAAWLNTAADNAGDKGFTEQQIEGFRWAAGWVKRHADRAEA